MATSGAAKRYAQAAFELAKSQDALDRWEQDLRRVSDTLTMPQVHTFFASPSVPDEAKRQALASLLPAEADQFVRNLMLLMLDRGRLDLVPAVAATFHDLVLDERGVAIANITTAVELQPLELQQVVSQVGRITGKEISPRTFVDESLIGGIVVRVGDQLIDGSVRTQLIQLREQMSR